MLKHSRFASCILVALALASPPALAAQATALKPIVGISIDNGDHPAVEASKLGMIEAVQRAGGIPLILNDRGDRSADKDIKQIDALIVQGDALDVDPAEYGQAKHKETHVETDKTRTDYENKIIPEALKAKIPVLLICGGMQRANVLMGGTLHQNIPDLQGVQPGHGNNHGNPPDVPSVSIEIASGSNFAGILGDASSKKPPTEMVNSFHHQALDKIGKGFRVVAFSDMYTRSDGAQGRLVEAIEADPQGPFAGQFILGLQFHPEMMPDNPMSAKIFNALIGSARNFASATGRLHKDEDVIRKVDKM